MVFFLNPYGFLDLTVLTGTVVTINEDPTPTHNVQRDQEHTIIATRRNLLNVFNQLSKANHTEENENPLSILPIRRIVQSPHVAQNKSTDALQSTDDSSLLFYYLFDDWYTTLSIVTRKEHKYAAKLSQLVSDRSCLLYLVGSITIGIAGYVF